jgi:hypothetical protein
MKTAIRVALVSVLCLVSGAAGFYLGFGAGARTLGNMVTQNRVSEMLGDIETSATTLDATQLTSLQESRTHRLRSTLFELGVVQDDIAYWACSPKDRAAIQKASQYLATHPNPPLAPELATSMSPLIEKGLRFCQDKDQYQRDDSYLWIF